MNLMKLDYLRAGILVFSRAEIYLGNLCRRRLRVVSCVRADHALYR